MPWVIGAVWVAWATATELSDSTLRAAARLTGAATLALMRDIAARSGSASPARASSSARVSLRYSCISLIGCSFRRRCAVRAEPFPTERAQNSRRVVLLRPCRGTKRPMADAPKLAEGVELIGEYDGS